MSSDDALYVLSQSRPDQSADADLERVWYTTTDGKSDLIYWVQRGQPIDAIAAITRFELYLGKEGIVWTSSGMHSYVEELKDKVSKASNMVNASPMLTVYSGKETMREFLGRLSSVFERYRAGLPKALSSWVMTQIEETQRVQG